MSVCAVVVTYNRVALLRECIDALRAQSRPPDEIIVVNNGSTDGTNDYARENSELTWICQENQGGAGGFATGLAAGFEKGHDWVWLMDDDCLPASAALESLMLVAGKIGQTYPLINSNCIKQHNPPIAEFNSLAAGDEYHLDGAALFNGTLIGRKAFDAVGNVNRELVIWGDETNYFMRIRNKFGNVAVARQSYLFHPPPMSIKETPNWKLYFCVRNAVYNAANHSRFGLLGVIYVVGLFGLEVITGRLYWRVFFLGCEAGLTGRLGWHNPFIGKGQ